MPRHPVARAASAHPHHRSGPLADAPRLNRSEPDPELRDNGSVGSPGQPAKPSLSAQPSDGPRLTAALSGRLPSRQAPEVNRSSRAGRQGTSPRSQTWRDQFLAEIGDLIAELREKVAHFALLRSVQSTNGASGPDNEAAVELMNEALEDIAAAALGIDLASHDGFHGMRSATGQDLIVETEQNQRQERQDD